ncbi:MAG: hypothetical protein FYV88_4580, partial [Bacteroidetes bacterium]|nr:hypothetical protein [Bacteroidota bacterium]
MAACSGQIIEWDKAINSGLDMSPKVYDWNAAPPVLPDSDGCLFGFIALGDI